MTTAELRRLLAEATPGPWESVAVPKDALEEQREYFIPSPAGLDGRIRWANSVWSDRPVADAALIVAAVSALPALLDVWEAARHLRRGEHPFKESREAYGALDAALAKLEEET